MSVTLDTSHFDKSLENLEAELNILFIVLTLEVFQLLMSELNALANQNIRCMSSTELTSHPDMSSLKVSLLENKFDISVT